MDWDEEIAQIVRKVYEQNGPALLFENIKGHENTRSRRLFTNGLGSQARVNLMLGLPKDTPMKEIVQTIRNRVREPLEPVRVSTEPVKENIVKGEDVNLFLRSRGISGKKMGGIRLINSQQTPDFSIST